MTKIHILFTQLTIIGRNLLNLKNHEMLYKLCNRERERETVMWCRGELGYESGDDDDNDGIPLGSPSSPVLRIVLSGCQLELSGYHHRG